MKTIFVDKEELKRLVDEGLTIEQISNKMNLSSATIRRRMLEYDLKSKFIECKYEEIKCAECSKIFKSLKTENRKFCSLDCCLKNNNRILKMNREDVNKKISKKMKKIDSKGICLNCHSEFEKRRKTTVYCSRKCQSKHISNKPENKERISRLFSVLTKKRHDEGDTRIGWQHRNKFSLSYPEKVTFDYLIYHSIEFERELKVGKYFIDFAFINKKIALEIDGRTHDDIEVIKKDRRKDKFLKSKGWKICRIKWINDNKHFDRLNAFIVQWLEQ